MLKMWSVKVIGVLLVAVLAQGCMVRATDYQALQNKLAMTEATIDDVRASESAKQAELDQMRAEYDQLKQQFADKDARISELQKPKEMPELQAIWDRLEALAGSRTDMTWDAGTRKLLVSVEFDLGKAAIQPENKSAIKQIAGVLKSMPPNYMAYIDGHTDNLPVKRQETVEKYIDNRGLAAARALAVYRVLEEGGVAPKLMVARGFGEYYPIDTNSTAEGRAKNRRVEISVIPDVAAFTPTAMFTDESDLAIK